MKLLSEVGMQELVKNMEMYLIYVQAKNGAEKLEKEYAIKRMNSLNKRGYSFILNHLN